MAEILSATGLTKEFSAGTPVLAEVGLRLNEGEVVALMGENGAGKSTLASILAGILPATSGSMALRGGPYRPSSRREAQRSGVAIVTQEMNLIPTLTVAENLTLDAMPSHLGVIDRKAQRESALEALGLAGAEDLDPSTPVADLGVAQRQLVEIAAGLRRECQVLILDEPTASLSPRESEELFGQVDRLRRRGASVVYISHRLEEVFRLADRIVVLRDGVVASVFPRGPDRDAVIRAMVGRDVSERIRAGHATAEPALEVRGVRGISLRVNRGEVVGLAGLVGAGRTELLRAIFGADRSEGEVLVGSRRVHPRRPGASVRSGVGFVTEDRKEQGLLLPLSVRENVTLPALGRLSRAGIVNRRRERETAERARGDLRVQCRDVDQPVARLSGGNQQKVVLARWLTLGGDVLLLDEPTRGIDVGARQEIYDLIEAMAGQGKAVLIASSDMQELFMVCDRILVISGGRVTDEMGKDEFDADRVMASALASLGGGD